MANQPWNSHLPLSLHIDTSDTESSHSVRDSTTVYQPYQTPRLYQPADPLLSQPIDGSLYDGTRPFHRMEVVKDMYDGQDPPKYKSQPSHSDLRQSSLLVTPERGRPCDSCGRQRSTRISNDHTYTALGECHKCGKRRASSDHPAHITLVPQSRSVSEGSATTLVDNSSPKDTESEPTNPRSKCSRCGKQKKPVVPTTSTQVSVERKPSSVLPPARHVASQHIMYSNVNKPPANVPSGMPRRKPVASGVPGILTLNNAVDIDIDIVPPTAISERPSSSVFQLPTVDKSPLLNGQSQSRPYTPGRSKSIASIASSISRSLSRRRSQGRENSENRQPSPQPSQSNDQGSATLFSMITNVLRGNEPRDYSRIDTGTDVETRPGSPFSFADRDGDDVIQLNDMPKQSHANHREEVAISAPHSEPLRSNPFDDPEPPQRPKNLRTRSDVLGSRLQVPPIPVDDSLPANPQRPTELVRFKSLRSGVSRAGSVARSTSLRRLNSLKNAPQYWYRTDMAIEGAMVGVF